MESLIATALKDLSFRMGFSPRGIPPALLKVTSLLTHLNSTSHRQSPSIRAIRLRTRVLHQVMLAVKITNKHRTIMQIAPRLISRKNRRLPALRRHISQTLAEAALAKLCRATKEFDGIIRAEGRDASLHGAIVLVTKRQNVGPHGLSLAFNAAAQPRRTNDAKSGYRNRFVGCFMGPWQWTATCRRCTVLSLDCASFGRVAGALADREAVHLWITGRVC